jgi:hypothetical protein
MKENTMALTQSVERQINAAISKIHQIREPVKRAKELGDLIADLQIVINALADSRRRAIAEAVQWPGASLATVAESLGVSKSAIAKLVTPDIREVVGNDLRKRLSGGLQLPPQRR